MNTFLEQSYRVDAARVAKALSRFHDVFPQISGLTLSGAQRTQHRISVPITEELLKHDRTMMKSVKFGVIYGNTYAPGIMIDLACPIIDTGAWIG